MRYLTIFYIGPIWNNEGPRMHPRVTKPNLEFCGVRRDSKVHAGITPLFIDEESTSVLESTYI